MSGAAAWPSRSLGVPPEAPGRAARSGRDGRFPRRRAAPPSARCAVRPRVRPEARPARFRPPRRSRESRPLRTFEGNILQRGSERARRGHREAGHLERRSPRRPFPPGSGVTRLAPTISSAICRAEAVFGSQVPTTLPKTQDRRLVAERADLLELVRDVEDRGALAPQLPQRLEENLHLLRCENTRRLVHDQEARLLQEQRTISTRWRSPADNSPTSRRGSSGSP